MVCCYPAPAAGGIGQRWARLNRRIIRPRPGSNVLWLNKIARLKGTRTLDLDSTIREFFH